MSRATHYYRGSRPCGCVCAMVMDDPDHADDTAKDVAEFIAVGYTVDRLPFPGAFTRCAAHTGLPHAEWVKAIRSTEEAPHAP